ncbi:FAD-dependent oxidoreductase [Adhaeribacter pallidiroseus]|uniref:Kynurenine 3-monooxygenase n=1 Tax=Adhaeribacter pallidiroseus TaxID=2072847 RepID=A0A369QC85_9BACT|nr:NAD(P)/FAD-dependent oxidoreductase [Adhaeribacter pallidiroseus]RDC62052.1 Kynurenine 3-monooxygenase [Adhaeribacter pallidiroseus]
MTTANNQVTVMGAGLVGSLLSLYLAKNNYQVAVYERRNDLRQNYVEYGRSINLALSDRGWKALEGVGIAEEIRKVAIPMYGRMMHDVQGQLSYQPYGKENQAIYSVSRGGLNVALMNLVDQNPNIDLHFNQQCLHVDLVANELEMLNTVTQEKLKIPANRLFGTDGAYSMVRYALQKTERYEFSQTYLEYGYKELRIAPGENNQWMLEKNALHIWPRGSYMMIALPNLDGSFTCTLFFPYEGDVSFNSLQTEADILDFFKKIFPDALPLMPDLVSDFFENPTGSLVTIKCFPWSLEDKVVLLGDAAHAIVPFYGQGMNAGFEDCTELNQLLEQHSGDWQTIFKKFQELRKPNTDAMAELAVQNFIEMRDLVADPRFLLRKKIESKINAQFPEKWLPLYTMVTYTHLPYSQALETGKHQDKIMKKLMKHITHESDYDKPEVQQLVQKLMR